MSLMIFLEHSFEIMPVLIEKIHSWTDDETRTSTSPALHLATIYGPHQSTSGRQHVQNKTAWAIRAPCFISKCVCGKRGNASGDDEEEEEDLFIVPANWEI